MSFVDRITRIGERLERTTTDTTNAYENTNTSFCELFANDRRQLIVQIVDDHGDITTRQLAEHIAAIETDTSLGDADRAAYKSVYVQLYQTHLAKLDNAGVVRYDGQAKHVTATNTTEEARALLAYITDTVTLEADQ